MNQSRDEITNLGRTYILATAAIGWLTASYFVPLSVYTQFTGRVALSVGALLGAAIGWFFFRDVGKR